MNKILLAAVMIAVSMTGLAETADEAAVRSSHEAFVKAAKTGDSAALDKLLAEGLQYSHSNGKLENKKEAIDALVKSNVNFEVHSQTIRLFGNTATIRAKATAHGASGDIPLTMLQVWTKNGGKWQMVERQTTRVPAP